SRWGISAMIAGEAGGIGISILRETSADNSISAGIGYWSNINLQLGEFDRPPELHRRELTLFIVDRYYITNLFYAIGGFNVRRVKGLLTGYGQEDEISLSSVGVPLALGLEFGRNERNVTTCFEVG